MMRCSLCKKESKCDWIHSTAAPRIYIYHVMCLPSSLTSKDVPHQLYILALHTYDAENHRAPPPRRTCVPKPLLLLITWSNAKARQRRCRLYQAPPPGRLSISHGSPATGQTLLPTRTRNFRQVESVGLKVGKRLVLGARLRRGALHLGRLWRRRPLRRLRRRRAVVRVTPREYSASHYSLARLERLLPLILTEHALFQMSAQQAPLPTCSAVEY